MSLHKEIEGDGVYSQRKKLRVLRLRQIESLIGFNISLNIILTGDIYGN
jgi:hypothetical protein